MCAEQKIIVALDFDSGAEVDVLLKRLPAVRWVKVGLQLFVREGAPLIARLKAQGLRVFLDLKFHDIPNTVAGAVRSAGALGVDMTTIHLVGGSRMIRSAVEASEGQLLVLGVSVLTSMADEDLRETGVALNPKEQALHLAAMGCTVGLPGVVASPHEAAELRARFGPDLKIVTPGVRLPGDAAGDQRRIMTPGQAVAAGADWLVVGRPITQAADPAAAFARVADDILAG